MNVQSNPIALAVFAIVAAVQNKGAASKDASKKEQSAIQAVRNYASVTADAGLPVEKATAVLRQAFKDAKVKDGTVKPYATAFTGYRQAIAEGVNIEDTGEKENGPSPLSAPKARTYNEGKERRAELKLLAEVRAEIAKRVRAIENLSDLIAFRDVLPEVSEEAVTKVAEPTAADLLAEMLGEDEESDAETEGAQEAVAA